MNAKWWTVGVVTLSGVCGCDSATSAGGGPPNLVATRTTVFGDSEGEGALSGVFSVAVAPTGHLFVSEPSLARVVEFAPDGTFSRVVGARGNGPGEFQVAGYIAWKEDSLAVSDFSRGISLFTPDGDFAGLISFNIRDGARTFGVRPMMLLSDGTVAAMAAAGSTDIASGRITHQTWLKTTRAGAVVDTLMDNPLQGSSYMLSYGGETHAVEQPLPWVTLMAPHPRGASFIVVERAPATEGELATYRVLRLGLDGDTVNQALVEYAPRPLTRHQIDSLAAVLGAGWGERFDAPAPRLAAEVGNQASWPAYLPPVTAAVAGADGTVWLRRETLGASVARWDVLDESLAPIGSVELPVDLEVKVVAVDHLYAVEVDALDVPSVVKYVVGRR